MDLIKHFVIKEKKANPYADWKSTIAIQTICNSFSPAVHVYAIAKTVKPKKRSHWVHISPNTSLSKLISTCFEI